MRIPGTLKALSAQLSAVGWGAPRSLSFHPDGSLAGIELGPPGAAPPAKGARRPEALPPTKPSAVESLSRQPPPFYPDPGAA